MIDRNVEFPNRFRMTKVEGTDDIYDLIPAPGEVIAPGDTFSKANMLPDSIPALLGLKMANPQVKDALNVLAHVGNLHVWERVQTYAEEVPAGYTLGELQENVLVFTENNDNKASVLYYADSISVDKYGIVSLVSPSSYAFYANSNFSPGYYAKGKFFYIIPNTGSTAIDGIWFLPSDSNLNRNGAQYFAPTIQQVTGYAAIPAGTTTDYLTSTDRNAYPDQSAEGSSYLLGESESKQVSEYYDTGTTRYLNLSYSDSVVISGDGSRVELNNPTTVEIGANASANFNVAKGKFCKFFQTSDTSVTVSITDLVFIPPDAEFSLTYPNSRYTVTCSKVQSVTVVPCTITYLGQLGEPSAKIEVGSYVGTGTYGSGNPNSLTFGFEPQLVAIFAPSGIGNDATKLFMLRNVLGASILDFDANDYGVIVTWSGKSVSWYTYSSSSSANGRYTYQMNTSRYTYHYIAIG